VQAELCPLDYHLDPQVFVHEGRGDLPDLDLEVASLHEPAVSAFLARYGSERVTTQERSSSSLTIPIARHCGKPTQAIGAPTSGGTCWMATSDRGRWPDMASG
jgi:hypothetical protein